MEYVSLMSQRLSLTALVTKYNQRIKNYDSTTQELQDMYSCITDAVKRYNQNGYNNAVLEASCYKQKCELIDRNKDGTLYVVFEWGVF